MAKEKTKQLGWYTTWINICLVWFLKEMQNWLMSIGFREAWQELFVLPCISWRTLISIPKVLAGGSRHPSLLISKTTTQLSSKRAKTIWPKIFFHVFSSVRSWEKHVCKNFCLWLVILQSNQEPAHPYAKHFSPVALESTSLHKKSHRRSSSLVQSNNLSALLAVLAENNRIMNQY